VCQIAHSGPLAFATWASTSTDCELEPELGTRQTRPGLLFPSAIRCHLFLLSQSHYPLPYMASPHAEVPAQLDSFEQRLREREHLQSRPLEMVPDRATTKPQGTIPNTPLVVSIISFLLGTTFALGSLAFLCGGLYGFWFATHQVGFFVASWSAFHWGEFAVTAGWNREKVSVDCAYEFFWSPTYLSIRSISP
jgi:hypothetical protein